MTIRAIAAESKVELFEGRIRDKDQVIEAWKGRADIAEKQLTLSLQNRTDAGRIMTIDQARVEMCQTQLSKADAEIHRLRNPPFFKRLFSTETLSGAMIGYGVGSMQK